MNALLKIRSISLKCLIALWISNWIALALDQMSFIWRFHGYPDDYTAYQSLLRYLALTAISLLVGRKVLTGNALGDQIPVSIAKSIAKEFPFCRLFNLLIVFFSTIMIVFISYFLSWNSFKCAIRPIACLVDCTKNYELTERIYKLSFDRDSDQCFASWRSSKFPEDTETRYARNAAVAKVYGDGGLEMMDRYLYIARNLDLTTAGIYPEESIYWEDRALSVNAANLAPDKVFCALSYQASLKLYQHSRTQTKALYRQCCNVLKNSDFLNNLDDHRKLFFDISLSSAAAISYHIKDFESARVFQSLLLRPKREQHSYRQIALLIYSLFMISLAASIGPIKFLWDSLLLARLYKRKEKILLSDQDILPKVESIGALIALDLFRQNFKRASQHSLRALELVNMGYESHSGELAEASQKLAAKRVIFDQIHATSTILLFLMFFLN